MLLNKNQALIDELSAYNNTLVWEYQGRIYIDSMKYPRVFKAALEALGIQPEECGWLIHHEPTDEEILFGNKASGLVFGGRKTICNVMSFRVPARLKVIAG